MKRILVLTIIVLAFSKVGFAQDPSNSIYSVSNEDKMYRMTIWRRVYMNEKINKSFFARNREISRILIDAVRDGFDCKKGNKRADNEWNKYNFKGG